MNKKGQGFGFIRILAFTGFFIIIFALALAPFVSTALGATDLSILGGFGEWAMSNLNVWFLGIFVLVVLVALVYGFSSE